jgi:hypothetical protein
MATYNFTTIALEKDAILVFGYNYFDFARRSVIHRQLLRLLVSTRKLVGGGLTPSMTSRNRLRLAGLHQQTVAAPSTSATALLTNCP